MPNNPYWLWSLITALLVVISSCTVRQTAVFSGFTIPEIQNVQIDGNPSEWTDQGAEFALVSDKYGSIDSADFYANVKLAWNATGISFFADVCDDTVQTATKKSTDHIEIFISSEKGSDHMVQYLFSGLFEDSSGIRIDKFDYLQGIPLKKVKEISAAIVKTSKGYSFETTIPASVLNMELLEGRKLYINFCFSDADGKKETRYPFYINDNTYGDHFALQEITLSKERESGIPVIGRARNVDKQKLYFQLYAAADLSGKEISVKDGDHVCASGRFVMNGDISVCNMSCKRSELMPGSVVLSVCSDTAILTCYYLRDIPLVFDTDTVLHKFESDICYFEELDRLAFPEPGSVLFIGSSSVRLWHTLKEDFPGFRVINRGFGGSRTEDAVYYFNRIVQPYKPAAIVLFTGSNDLNAKMTPAEVVGAYVKFINLVHDSLPESKLIVLSIKVSVSTKKLTGEVMKTNELLKKEIARHKDVEYVDVVGFMLKNDQPDAEIFCADSTHMNPEGYKMLTQTVKPVLEKILKTK